MSFDITTANNELSGTIPTVLGQLQLLETCRLSNNTLTGSVPSEVGSLQNLLVFNIGMISEIFLLVLIV